MRLRSLALICAAATAAVSTVHADERPATGIDAVDPVPAVVLTPAEIAPRLQGVTPDNIKDSPIAGLYQIVMGSGVSYITKDGRYWINGEVIDVETHENFSERTRANIRAKLLAAVDPSTEIVFSPAGEVKHRVIVFTDVDCGFCRQFHREIAAVTALGIEVHYLSYPRTGPDSASWAKAEGVWCAKDRKEALTKAKLGGAVEHDAECKTAAVGAQYLLGHQVGLSGTPGVYSESGVLLGGYLPPDQLLAALEKADAGAKK